MEEHHMRMRVHVCTCARVHVYCVRTCMCVHVRVYVCARVCTCVRVCFSLHVSICVSVNMYLCVSLSLCLCAYVCVSLCLCVSLCMCLCVSVNMCVSVWGGWVSLCSSSGRSPQRQAGCPSICRHDRLWRGYVGTSLCTHALPRYLKLH